jgi:hypothetical protein
LRAYFHRFELKCEANILCAWSLFEQIPQCRRNDVQLVENAQGAVMDRAVLLAHRVLNTLKKFGLGLEAFQVDAESHEAL